MVKKMVYLDEDHDRLLKELAAEQQVAETEIVRRALESYAAAIRENPMMKLVGLFSGGDPNLSDDHDEVLAELVEEKLRRGGQLPK